MSACTCLGIHFEPINGVMTQVGSRTMPDCPQHGTVAVAAAEALAREKDAGAREQAIFAIERELNGRVEAAIEGGRTSTDEVVRMLAELRHDLDTRRR